jgi:hypothetical protein
MDTTDDSGTLYNTSCQNATIPIVLRIKGQGVVMEFDELSQEMKDRARACKTPEEVLELAKEEGITLSDAELDQIAGGRGKWAHEQCDDFVRQGKPRKK